MLINRCITYPNFHRNLPILTTVYPFGKINDL